ncbi:hypothetical protein PPL_06998 [Heterostelium album PN500]|uniref:EGF-like domain-containing protein n=1 Tax=Heterostelium pallidum (strain ATCC 26659 / Pp 5 / PN500) TaxID=670386 RepID=D3BE45_HETP5|nr:hypothetical protein PPL_06998 [Heterostelium album PN500]EFA80176.1 hypothetical protein PPL_06998 [Heterostelium album PN500]|eukprot:XP_020432296.1 hypothetical protein PPL_06998 [Heterostelium album PN500]
MKYTIFAFIFISFYLEETNLCDKSGVSVLLSANYIVRPDNFEIYGVGGVNFSFVNSYQDSVTNQVLFFQLSAFANSISYLSLKYTNSTYENQTFTDFYQIQCEGIAASLEFKIGNVSTLSMIDPYTMAFYIQFNIDLNSQTGSLPYSYNIKPYMDSPYRCELTLVKSNNVFLAKVYLEPSYTILEPRLTINFTLSSYNRTFSFASPFPWDSNTLNLFKDSSAVRYVSYFTYPNITLSYSEDFTFQMQTMNKFSLLAIENVNLTRFFYKSPEASFYQQYRFVHRDSEASYYIGGYQYETSNMSNFESVECSKYSLVVYDTVYLSKFPLSIVSTSTLKQFTNDSLGVTFVRSEFVTNYLQQVKVDTGTVSRSFLKTIISYPFARNSSGFFYKFEDSMSSNFSGKYISSSINLKTDSNISIVSNSKSLIKTSKYNIKKIELIPVTSYYFIFRISIESNFDIRYISFGETDFLYSSDLIFGDSYNGIYEKLLKISKPSSFSVRLLDELGNSYSIQSGQAYNSDFLVLPYYRPFNLNAMFDKDNITYFSFKNSLWDIKANYSNTLYFNFSNSYPDLTPTITFNDKYQFQGFYHPVLRLYTIQFDASFPIMNGALEYSISDLIIGSIIPSSLIQLNSSLTVVNSDGISPALLFYLKAFPSTNEIYNQKVSVGWILGVSDPLGFESGSFDVVSDVDANPYKVRFDKVNLENGTLIHGTYRVSIPLYNIGIAKKLSISNLILVNQKKRVQDFNPLVGILDKYSDQLKISINYTVEYISNNPKIDSLTFTDSVEIYGPNRAVDFTMIVNYGSNSYRDFDRPIFVLTSENGQSFNMTTSLARGGGSSQGTYTATAQLPYGFGWRRIYVSVYGIVDAKSNYNAYLPTDLRDAGLPFFIVRKTKMTVPIIESSSLLSSLGGSLTIYGKQFGIPKDDIRCFINYNDGIGYQQIDADFLSSVVLQFNNKIKQTNSSSVDIVVTRNKIESNIFKIYLFKAQLDPIPSNICPGSPQCSNHGVCRSSGCECQKPWYGPSCSSQIIIIPTPPAQPDPSTNVTIFDPTNTNINNISSRIQVIEVREIDSIMNIVNSYKLSNWNLNDLSNQTDHPKYLYQSLLEGTNTTVNISIEFFNDSRSIDFGGQQILISPSSIKYSINISSFNFQLKTNMLQVVLEATIQGSDSESCSSKQIGSNNSTNDVKWIKMNIDKTSLYGRFISYGIVDTRVVSIDNRVLDIGNQTESSQYRSTTIGITVPYFENSALLDPDFSYLIDVDGEDVDQLCSSKSDKKLSNGIIAAIVVAAVVFITIVLAK